MTTITDPAEGHRLYEELQKRRPDLFRSNEDAEYITDPEIVADYERETGERIGVFYKKGDYELFVVDLVRRGGEMTVHGRVVLPFNGVIIVPKVGEKFVLEVQYRYPNCKTYIAFPRGHCEPGATPAEDAVREVREELAGAALKNLVPLGKTYPETHSDAWFCSVFLGEVEGVTADADGAVKMDGYEGINSLRLFTAEELDTLISSGEIDCGYTLAAWALYKAHEKKA